MDVKHFDFVDSVPLNIKLERTFLLLERFQNEQLLKFNTSSPKCDFLVLFSVRVN